ncbi:MAG TPA: AAA family ATPase [Nostocaceae cyanobacterium]|nr:AAA family ATPase [Nostocaceae cyanobacterium]
MKLTRVQVPDFRVLKNIDIEFEKEFFPSIFPLGSQNGGGKSTLLQLIFTLLHCSVNPERQEYLQNLLQGFQVPEDATERELATLHIWDDKKEIILEFLAVHDNFIKNLLEPQIKYHEKLMNLSIFKKLNEIQIKVDDVALKISIVEDAIIEINTYMDIENETVKIRQLQSVSDKLYHVGVNTALTIQDIMRYKKEVEEKLAVLKINYDELDKEYVTLRTASSRIEDYLKKNSLTYICNYFSNSSTNLDYESNNAKFYEKFLVCKTIGTLSPQGLFNLLKKLSNKIFLAAPVGQVFLFTSQKSKNLLFQQNSYADYYFSLKTVKSDLPGLFTYEFVSVDLLIQAFKTARDKDFIEAIETEGQYGKHYPTLLNDLNLFLGNKKLNISKDFSKVTFKLNRENVDIEINPEDLSHGEMKKLSIYMWIKYGNIPEGSIVLMDEVEIALHPDWQYQIILDLEEWSPNNQYILATHSYELCQPLTPAHVKSLDPKLIKSEAKN